MFETECFLTCSWRFLKSDKLEQLKFKLEKILGLRNMQEKLENNIGSKPQNSLVAPTNKHQNEWEF